MNRRFAKNATGLGRLVVRMMVLVSVSLALGGSVRGQNFEWEPMLKKIAARQDAAGVARDRSIYRMKISITRFKKSKNDWKEKIVSRRISTAEIAPNAKGEIATRLLTDTDKKGRPKKKVNPKDRLTLGTAAFMEALFFPFYPEKILKYELADIKRYKEKGQPALALSFIPKLGIADAPLIEGTGYFLEETGEIVKLEIKALVHFEIIDKNLRKLERLEATVEYAPNRDGVYLPVRAWGRGYAKLKQIKGDFRFLYEESGHKLSPFYAK
ncbi:MAG: hypothetical protein ACE5G5_07080 [Candidatus Methylomirabilales bacterium]